MSSRLPSAEKPVLRLPFGRSLTAAGVIVLVAVGLVLAGIIVAVTDDDGAAGVPRTSQSASASEAGVTLSSPSAVFSGTSTRLRIDVALDDTVGPLQQVSIPGDAITLSGFQSSGAVRLPPRLPLLSSERVELTLPPIAESGDPAVSVTRIDVQLADGTIRQLEGSWTLTLTPPDDRAESLRTEHLLLAPASPANQDLVVEVVSAVRSRSETRVVLGAAWRGEAVIPARQSSSRNPLGDIAIDPWASRDGMAVLVLPPSRFGEPAFVSFDAWALASEPGWSVLDLHPLVSAGNGGAVDRASLILDGGALPGDTFFLANDDGLAIEMRLGDVPIGRFQGLYDEHRIRSIVLPTGEAVFSSGGSVGRQEQAIGEVRGVAVLYDFDVGLDALDGLVILHHPRFADGGPSGTVPFGWTGQFVPAGAAPP